MPGTSSRSRNTHSYGFSHGSTGNSQVKENIFNLKFSHLNMVVEILVLLMADVTGRSLRQVNLLDVVFQCILGYKLLLTERTLSHLKKKKCC